MLAGDEMARPKKNNEGLKKPVSVRLSETDHAAYMSKVEASGLSQSDFFRQCVLTNKTQIIAKQKAPADLKRLQYLFNKTSNNMNQLAYRANSDFQSGKLNEKTYEEILNNLDVISRYLKATLNHVE